MLELGAGNNWPGVEVNTGFALEGPGMVFCFLVESRESG